MSSSPPPTDTPPEPGWAQSLAEVVRQGHSISKRADLPPGLVRMWTGRIRTQIRKGFGVDSEAERLWPIAPEGLTPTQARDLILARLAKAEALLSSLNSLPARTLGGVHGQRIFIGHGRSPVWREFKDFLQDRLHLPWEEFNRESAAGIATTEKLDHLLNVSTFAFLIMTAEDEHADQTRHARLNVIHEVGLFQGKLGTRKAIVLLEDGCEKFSNIHGLTHIPFPPGRVIATFEEVRRVLEREGVTEA